MSRITRWATVALTSAALIAVPQGITDAQSLTKSQVEAQIRQAHDAQVAAQVKIATMKAHIGQLHAKEAVLTTQLSTIEAAVSQTQTQIDTTAMAIQARNNQIQQTKAQISVAQGKLQSQYQVLTNRLRIMYEVGHASYLEVLFSSSSFSDLLSRFHMLTLVAQQDRTVFDSVQAEEQHLKQEKDQLDAMMRQQQADYAILLHKKADLSTQQASQRRILGKVQNQAASESADMNNEQNALADVGSQLKQLQKELGAFKPPPSSQPSGPWAWPVPGYTSISSGYGERTLFGRPDFHPGIDIPAPIGTPIVAATAGKVLFAGPASGYGNWIVIDSGDGLMEIYGHMYSNELEVAPGQIVQRGQEIARVGNDGESTGAHLHFEVSTGIGGNGIPISTDPTKYVG